MSGKDRQNKCVLSRLRNIGRDGEDVTSSGRSFHIRAAATLEVAVLAFNCIRVTGPVYFNGVCTSLADIPGRSSLRTADRGDFLIPSTKTKIGSRSFRIVVPTVWNSLSFICMTELSVNDNFDQG